MDGWAGVAAGRAGSHAVARERAAAADDLANAEPRVQLGSKAYIRGHLQGGVGVAAGRWWRVWAMGTEDRGHVLWQDGAEATLGVVLRGGPVQASVQAWALPALVARLVARLDLQGFPIGQHS